MDPAYILSLNPVVVAQVLILILLMVFLFLFFGALAAGVEDITWTKVFLASVVGVSAQWAVAVVLSIIPLVGGLLGFIFSILAMIFVLRFTFVVPWRRAAMIFALAAVAEITTGVVLVLYTGIDLLTFAQRLFFVA
ncbi:MAG: hypothetical protein ACE5G7_06680 [Candidatus Hydrothermarchaeaceae archaeon]